EIGLFATTIDTADNVRVIVGNNKLFGDNIVNYTHNEYRRVDLKAQIAHAVDPLDAIKQIKDRVAKIPNVRSDPAPSVDLLEFNEAGTLIAVRPYCHNDHYWQGYFDTTLAIQAPRAKAAAPNSPPPHT